MVNNLYPERYILLQRKEELILSLTQLKIMDAIICILSEFKSLPFHVYLKILNENQPLRITDSLNLNAFNLLISFFDIINLKKN